MRWLFSTQNVVAKLLGLFVFTLITHGAWSIYQRQAAAVELDERDRAFGTIAENISQGRESELIDAAGAFLQIPSAQSDSRRDKVESLYKKAQLQQGYLATLAAAQSGDLDRLIEAGLGFAKDAYHADNGDARLAQVKDLVSRAMLSRMFELNRQNKPQEVAQLIEKYNQVLQPIKVGGLQ